MGVSGSWDEQYQVLVGVAPLSLCVWIGGGCLDIFLVCVCGGGESWQKCSGEKMKLKKNKKMGGFFLDFFLF